VVEGGKAIREIVAIDVRGEGWPDAQCNGQDGEESRRW